MGKRDRHQEFYDDEFEALNSYGLNRGKVARLVHSSKKSKVKKATKPVNVQVDLDNLSRKELLIKAEAMGIATNAKMSRRELVNAIKGTA
ncbi:MAG: Rho termination factor N-terminal domain-containing protein [Candidatus Cyclobacteriaceae bacterium M3_2C_046]